MLTLDGGEAGGQFVRSATSLAAITGEPITVTNIRGARSTPGLRPQHLAAVQLTNGICDGELTGASEGSEEFSFTPQPPTGGEYAIDIQTAGSIPLVFDTILPLATRIDTPLHVTITGGTDVKWAPPLDYFREVKLQLLRQFGLVAVGDTVKRGYYPTGGGHATIHIAPASMDPIEITTRGELTGAGIHSGASEDLADQTVSERQADSAVDRLRDLDIPILEQTTSYCVSESTGSAILITLDYANSRAGFDALGESGKPAETVSAEAVDSATAYMDGVGAVDPHLADQLLIFIALAGGRVVIPEETSHVTTSLDLLDSFGFDVSLKPHTSGGYLVERP